MGPIRLLIADDSVVSRQMLKSILNEVAEFEVVAVASNGRTALERITQFKPDVVILDIEMPELDGLETLKEIRRQHGALPVIMFSAMTETDASITIQALSLGADDYVTKPSTRERVQPDTLCTLLLEAFVPRIQALAQRHRPGRLSHEAMPQPFASHSRMPCERIEAIGIAISTGGPNALSEMIPALPGDLCVPLLLVQHMPPLFTRSLAERLDKISAIKVCEAQDGMLLEAGCAYVAPGNYHLGLRRQEDRVQIVLSQQPPENSCRPSADVSFRALAAVYGSAALGVVMTGMGQDGLRGCEAIREAGGRILAQDEASSTIWGMPGYVVRAGLADKVLPLKQLAGEITRLAQHSKAHRKT